MAIEAKRGCGFRKVGGIYLMGGRAYRECDRLPLPIGSCPVCGEGLHFTRAVTEINAYKLFGNHIGCEEEHACNVCRPSLNSAYLMMVGEKFYSPDTFVDESILFGVCKRIPFIPRKLVLGKSVVYLAHKHVIKNDEGDDLMAIFSSFVVLRVEQLIWQKDATAEEMEGLVKRGITPVVIPDGDIDHTP